jgi:pimeloyl-ACP methyl ester carboxylesterase
MSSNRFPAGFLIMPFLSSSGLKIFYADISPSEDKARALPPVLLIHGFASNHRVNWVGTLWTKTLTGAGRRVIALDNRGHGESERPYEPQAYDPMLMAGDAASLLDVLGIEKADVMGYSMGGRIAAHMAVQFPERVRSLLIGGLGDRLVLGSLLPQGIAEAMEIPDPSTITDPTQKLFRAFAEQTGSDLRAMAACIRGSRRTLSPAELATIRAPTLISIGTKDEVAGSARNLAVLMKNAQVLDIPGKDHNLAVGDRIHKTGVLDFLQKQENNP